MPYMTKIVFSANNTYQDDFTYTCCDQGLAMECYTILRHFRVNQLFVLICALPYILLRTLEAKNVYRDINLKYLFNFL